MSRYLCVFVRWEFDGNLSEGTWSQRYGTYAKSCRGSKNNGDLGRMTYCCGFDEKAQKIGTLCPLPKSRQRSSNRPFGSSDFKNEPKVSTLPSQLQMWCGLWQRRPANSNLRLYDPKPPPSVKLIPMELHLPDLQGWQHDIRYKLPFSGELLGNGTRFISRVRIMKRR